MSSSPPLVARGPFATAFPEIESKSREDLVYLARLAEQCERYDEMTELMGAVVRRNDSEEVLSDEERNILSVAFKNTVGARRGSWRAFSTIYDRKKQKGNEDQAEMALKYKRKVESELDAICGSILSLVDTYILPRVTSAEAKVFYYKMRGDYYRYIAEYASEDKKSDAADKSHDSYKKASEIADTELAPTNPIRLGLALNYSVFYFEIRNDSTNACKLAKDAFDAAVAQLDTVSGDNYRDSTLIMHLLRDNLSLWSPAATEGADPSSSSAAAAANPVPSTNTETDKKEE